ncbi:MAG TPA: S41 family peptidase [Candidatus Methanofastidiosa archaeon]|nr:S41 family peptidase [Candidatus Methanofastidiosa archaeon]
MDPHSDEVETIPLNIRSYVISKTYHSVLEYFAHWDSKAYDTFENDYISLIDQAIEMEERFSFDMLMMEFLSKLNNGHTWFSDGWLLRNFNQALPIEFGYISGKWVVLRSAVEGIRPGSIIETINNLPFEEFYDSRRGRVSASSERGARSRFPSLYYLLPRRCVLNVDMCEYEVSRERASYFVSKPIEGYWLEKDRTALIRIRQFSKSTEEDAIRYVREFFGAKRLIIDVRGNKGGMTPVDLVRHLMDRPFVFWRESTPANFGLFRYYGDFVRANRKTLSESMLERLSMAEIFSSTELSWAPEETLPKKDVYSGDIYILTDRYCRSAGEDFILPFKESGRGIIVGEATMGSSGQPYNYNFDNGMQLFIGTKRVSFPDGSRFEGVGIHPDAAVKTTIEDISNGVDPVMEYCLSQV